MKNRLINWVLLLVALMLVVNIIRSWIYLSQRGDIIRQTQERLKQVREENEELKRKKAQVESEQYIEREARNRLNLGREGEVVLLLPSISPSAEPTPTPVDTSSNLIKWVKVFFQ